jgi:lipopolysaccharide/colanic/teichoic acid biosynthesis glycosyltransferase
MPYEPSWYQRLVRGIEPITLGVAALGSLMIGVALAVSLGALVGFVGIGAAIAGFVILYCAGVLVQETNRCKLRDAAFHFRGSVVDAHPIEHFFVKPWFGRSENREMPPWVERSVMGRVLAGLGSQRLVIVKGGRESGLSRLVYEVACKFNKRMVMVTKRMGVASEDALAMLMRDPGGFAAEESQILVIRDFATRLVAGGLTAEFIRDWLARHPQVSIIVTLSPAELERLKAAGDEAEVEFGKFEDCAAVVRLAARLKGGELAEARRKFAGLTRSQLEWLPRYLISADPARRRFLDGKDDHPLGFAIVRAAADWLRVGGIRPVPTRYLRAVAHRYAGDAVDFDFDAALAWATESHGESVSLVHEVREDGNLIGYEVNRAILDLLDDREGGVEPFAIPEFVWDAVESELLGGAATDAMDEDVAEQLISIGKAALARERPRIAARLLKQAARLGSGDQRQRIVQILSAGPGVGSAPHSLINSRRGDGILPRLRAIEDLAHARKARRKPRRQRKPGMPTAFFAWIYRRRAMRTAARLAVLVVADVSSALAGLGIGLVLRALLANELDWGAIAGTLSDSFALWSAIVVFACALARLYRQDSERARLGAIVLVMAVMAGTGFVASLADGFALPTALLAALAGGVGAAWIDYWMRARYDHVSRAWVKDHGLQARTLVVGSRKQAARVRQALADLSRPTVIVGYVTTSKPADEEDLCLGSVEDLAKVAVEHEAGRVLIADTGMSAEARQELADRCHLRGLRVEAVPSLADIRSGSAGFVSGQSLVLIPLVPLWQSDPGFFAKRAMDVCISLAALAVIWPALVLIALGTWATSGRILTRSWRPGLGGSVFGLYRFHTATRDSGSSADPSDPDSDPDRDPTAFGAWLRSHGLDELPQLVNVLLGQMSLVGPRPLRIAAHSTLEDEHLVRYVVRPGATGPWQICKRPTLTHEELFNLDMTYLRHWSILVDLEILVRTVGLMIRGRRHLPRLVPPDDLGTEIIDFPSRHLSREVKFKPRRKRGLFRRRKRGSEES